MEEIISIEEKYLLKYNAWELEVEKAGMENIYFRDINDKLLCLKWRNGSNSLIKLIQQAILEDIAE